MSLLSLYLRQPLRFSCYDLKFTRCLGASRVGIRPSHLHPFISLRPARGTIAKRCVPWSDLNPWHRDGVLEFWKLHSRIYFGYDCHTLAHLILYFGALRKAQIAANEGLQVLDDHWKLQISAQTFRRFFTRALAQVEENALEELAELVPEKKNLQFGETKMRDLWGDGFRSCGSDMRMVPFLRCGILQ